MINPHIKDATPGYPIQSSMHRRQINNPLNACLMMMIMPLPYGLQLLLEPRNQPLQNPIRLLLRAHQRRLTPHPAPNRPFVLLLLLLLLLFLPGLVLSLLLLVAITLLLLCLRWWWLLLPSRPAQARAADTNRG